MENMFSYCVSLLSLDLSNFNTQNVIDIEYMFNNCHSLSSSLDLSNYNTQNVTNMKSIFCYYNSLINKIISIFLNN